MVSFNFEYTIAILQVPKSIIVFPLPWGKAKETYQWKRIQTKHCISRNQLAAQNDSASSEKGRACVKDQSTPPLERERE